MTERLGLEGARRRPADHRVPARRAGTDPRVRVRKLVYGPGRGEVIAFSDPTGLPDPGRGIVGGGFVHRPSAALGIERPEREDFIERVIAGRIH